MQNEIPSPDDINVNKTSSPKNIEIKRATAAPQSESSNVISKNGNGPSFRSSRKGFKLFLGFVLSIVGLFAIFYGLLLVVLLNGDLSNPLFQSIGLNGAELKSSLLLITNSIFGFISLIFLIACLIKFFQWIITPKDSFNKRDRIKSVGIYFIILILTIGIWVTLFWIILNSSTKKNTDETTLIVTDPINTIGLNSPKIIKFDIGEKIYKQIPPELIRKISWDFNADGVYDASGSNVTYEFLNKGSNDGRYEVSVDVIYFSPETKQEVTYSDSKEVIISNEKVIADLKASHLLGQAPLAVNLSAKLSNDPDGNIVFYEWDLDGDDDYEIRGKEKVEVDTVFSTIGEHPIKLRVTGQNNDISTESKIIVVKAPDEKIRAEISSENSSFSGLAPLNITLDGSQSFTKKGQIIQYQWNIEGEQKSTFSRKIQRSFAIPGEYKITLKIENQEGDHDEAIQIINVFERSEIAMITNPLPDENTGIITKTVPFEVIFDSAPSEIPQAVEWQWDFNGDSIIDDFGEKSSYIFKKAGKYEAKLIIINSNNQKFEKIQPIVALLPKLVANIQADPISGTSPLIINFDGSGSSIHEGEIINYVWEFPGLDPIYSSAKITKEFKQVGTFPIKLTVISNTGEKDSIEKLISVRGQLPEAHINFSPKGGDAPLEVKFDSKKSKGNIVEYLWNFGDGNIAQSINPNHIFNIPGTYTIKLRITDEKGLVSETSETIVIN